MESLKYYRNNKSLNKSLICNILNLRVGFRLNRQNKLEISSSKRYRRLTINILKIVLYFIGISPLLSCNGNISSIGPIFWLLSKRTLINLLLSTPWLPCLSQTSLFLVIWKKKLLSSNFLSMVVKLVFIRWSQGKKQVDHPSQIFFLWEN